MAKKTKKPKVQLPTRMAWGRTIGLLVACIATIVGAWQGVGLSHLLFRAAVGSLIVCVVVGIFARLVSSMTSDPDTV